MEKLIKVIVVIIIIVLLFYVPKVIVKFRINNIIAESEKFISENKIEKTLKYLSDRYFDEIETSRDQMLIKIKENKKKFKVLKFKISKKEFLIVLRKKVILKIKVYISIDTKDFGIVDKFKTYNVVFEKENSEWKVVKLVETDEKTTNKEKK